MENPDFNPFSGVTASEDSTELLQLEHESRLTDAWSEMIQKRCVSVHAELLRHKLLREVLLVGKNLLNARRQQLIDTANPGTKEATSNAISLCLSDLERMDREAENLQSQNQGAHQALSAFQKIMETRAAQISDQATKSSSDKTPVR